jgi:hypothetical protein
VREIPADLPHIIASGVSTSVATAAAAIAPIATKTSQEQLEAIAPSGAKVITDKGVTVATAANGAKVAVYPPNAQGISRVVAIGRNGATAVSYTDARAIPGLAGAIAVPPASPAPPLPPREQRSAIDRAIEMKAVGLTPEYIAAIKSVLPQLQLSGDDLVELKGAGVTPDFIQELAREGYRMVAADDIAGAYAVGIRADYIRAMSAAGYGGIPLEQLTELKAVGVTPADVERFRRAGFTHLDVEQIVQAKALGLTPEEIRASRNGP